MIGPRLAFTVLLIKVSLVVASISADAPHQTGVQLATQTQQDRRGHFTTKVWSEAASDQFWKPKQFASACTAATAVGSGVTPVIVTVGQLTPSPADNAGKPLLHDLLALGQVTDQQSCATVATVNTATVGWIS